MCHVVSLPQHIQSHNKHKNLDLEKNCCEELYSRETLFVFDENGLVAQEVYKKLLFGKLEVNEGMFFENILHNTQTGLMLFILWI